jgi:hypothetical protein
MGILALAADERVTFCFPKNFCLFTSAKSYFCLRQIICAEPRVEKR